MNSPFLGSKSCRTETGRKALVIIAKNKRKQRRGRINFHIHSCDPHTKGIITINNRNYRIFSERLKHILSPTYATELERTKSTDEDIKK